MSIAFATEVVGLNALNALIGHTKLMAQDPFERAPARTIRDRYIDRVNRAFESRGQSVGGWPALSSSYARSKARTHPSRPLLVRTGEMKQALTSKGHPSFIFERRPGKLVLGSSSSVAGFHQTGGRRLPRRPLFVSDASWGEEVAEIVRDHWFGGHIGNILRIL